MATVELLLEARQANSTLEKIDKKFEKVDQTVDKFSSAVERLEATLDKLAASIDKVVKPIQQMNKMMGAMASTTLKMYKDQIKGLTEQNELLWLTLKKVQNDLKNTAINLEQAAKKANKADKAIEKLNKQAEKSGHIFMALGFNLGAVKKASDALSFSLKRNEYLFSVLIQSVATFISQNVIGYLVRMTDQYKLLESRLRIVNSNLSTLNTNMSSAVSIALETRQSLFAVGNLMSRIGRNSKELSQDTYKLAEATRTISKAFQVAGATAEEARNAIVQLSQALASGRLQGDELRSILELAPTLANSISKAIGITVGQLRAFAREGLITTDIILSAVSESVAEINKDFAKIKPTVSQAITNIQTAFQAVLGGNKDIAKANDYLAASFLNLSKVILKFGSDGEKIKGLTEVIKGLADNVVAIGAGFIAGATSLAKFILIGYGLRKILDLLKAMEAVGAALFLGKGSIMGGFAALVGAATSLYALVSIAKDSAKAFRETQEAMGLLANNLDSLESILNGVQKEVERLNKEAEALGEDPVKNVEILTLKFNAVALAIQENNLALEQLDQKIAETEKASQRKVSQMEKTWRDFARNTELILNRVIQLVIDLGKFIFHLVDSITSGIASAIESLAMGLGWLIDHAVPDELEVKLGLNLEELTNWKEHKASMIKNGKNAGAAFMEAFTGEASQIFTDFDKWMSKTSDTSISESILDSVYGKTPEAMKKRLAELEKMKSETNANLADLEREQEKIMEELQKEQKKTRDLMLRQFHSSTQAAIAQFRLDAKLAREAFNLAFKEPFNIKIGSVQGALSNFASSFQKDFQKELQTFVKEATFDFEDFFDISAENSPFNAKGFLNLLRSTGKEINETLTFAKREYDENMNVKSSGELEKLFGIDGIVKKVIKGSAAIQKEIAKAGDNSILEQQLDFKVNEIVEKYGSAIVQALLATEVQMMKSLVTRTAALKEEGKNIENQKDLLNLQMAYSRLSSKSLILDMKNTDAKMALQLQLEKSRLIDAGYDKDSKYFKDNIEALETVQKLNKELLVQGEILSNINDISSKTKQVEGLGRELELLKSGSSELEIQRKLREETLEEELNIIDTLKEQDSANKGLYEQYQEFLKIKNDLLDKEQEITEEIRIQKNLQKTREEIARDRLIEEAKSRGRDISEDMSWFDRLKASFGAMKDPGKKFAELQEEMINRAFDINIPTSAMIFDKGVGGITIDRNKLKALKGDAADALLELYSTINQQAREEFSRKEKEAGRPSSFIDLLKGGDAFRPGEREYPLQRKDGGVLKYSLGGSFGGGFVLQKNAVRKYGPRFLDNLNSGRFSGVGITDSPFDRGPYTNRRGMGAGYIRSYGRPDRVGFGGGSYSFNSADKWGGRRMAVETSKGLAAERANRWARYDAMSRNTMGAGYMRPAVGSGYSFGNLGVVGSFLSAFESGQRRYGNQLSQMTGSRLERDRINRWARYDAMSRNTMGAGYTRPQVSAIGSYGSLGGGNVALADRASDARYKYGLSVITRNSIEADRAKRRNQWSNKETRDQYLEKINDNKWIKSYQRPRKSVDFLAPMSDRQLQYLSGRTTSSKVNHYVWRKGDPIGVDGFAAGGMIQGPSHAKGGVKGFLYGQPIELEGGEYVISKDAVAKYGMPLFESLNARKFAPGGPLDGYDIRVVMKQANRMAAQGFTKDAERLKKMIAEDYARRGVPTFGPDGLIAGDPNKMLQKGDRKSIAQDNEVVALEKATAVVDNFAKSTKKVDKLMKGDFQQNLTSTTDLIGEQEKVYKKESTLREEQLNTGEELSSNQKEANAAIKRVTETYGAVAKDWREVSEEVLKEGFGYSKGTGFGYGGVGGALGAAGGFGASVYGSAMGKSGRGTEFIENIVKLGEDPVGGVIDILGDLLASNEKFNAALERFLDLFYVLFDEFAEGFALFFEAIVDFLNPLKPLLQSVGAAFKGIMRALTQIIQPFAKLLESLQPIIIYLSAFLQLIVGMFSQLVGGIAQIIDSAVSGLIGVFGVDTQGYKSLNILRQERDLLSEISSLFSSLNSAVESIRDVVYEIMTSTLNIAAPGIKLELATQKYNELFAAATAIGDTKSIEEFQNFAKEYLQASQDVLRTSNSYQKIYMQVIEDLNSLTLNMGDDVGYEFTSALKQAIFDLRVAGSDMADELVKAVDAYKAGTLSFTDLATYVDFKLSQIDQDIDLKDMAEFGAIGDFTNVQKAYEEYLSSEFGRYNDAMGKAISNSSFEDDLALLFGITSSGGIASSATTKEIVYQGTTYQVPVGLVESEAVLAATTGRSLARQPEIGDIGTPPAIEGERGDTGSGGPVFGGIDFVELIGTLIQKIWDAIVEAVGNVIKTAEELLGALFGWIKDLGITAVKFLEELFKNIFEGTRTALEALGDFFGEVLNLNELPTALQGLGKFFEEIINLDSIPTALQGLGKFFEEILDLTDVPTALGGLGEFFSQIMNLSELPTALGGLGEFFSKILNLDSTLSVTDALGKIVQEIFDGATGSVDLADLLGEILDSIFGTEVTPLTVFQGLEEFFNKIIDSTRLLGVSTAFSTFLENIIDMTSDLLSFGDVLQEIFDKIFGGGTSGVLDVWDAFVAIIDGIFKSVTDNLDLTTGLSTFLTKIFKGADPLDALKGLGEFFTKVLGADTTNPLSAIEKIIKTILGGAAGDPSEVIKKLVEATIGGATETAENALKAIMEALVSGTRSVQDFVKDILNTIVSGTTSAGEVVEGLFDELTKLVESIFMFKNPFYKILPPALGGDQEYLFKFAEHGGMVQYASGGMLDGPSHKNGGIKAMVGNSGMIEMEGGEYIINKRTVSELGKEFFDFINFANPSAPLSLKDNLKFASGGYLGKTKDIDIIASEKMGSLESVAGQFLNSKIVRGQESGSGIPSSNGMGGPFQDFFSFFNKAIHVIGVELSTKGFLEDLIGYHGFEMDLYFPFAFDSNGNDKSGARFFAEGNYVDPDAVRRDGSLLKTWDGEAQLNSIRDNPNVPSFVSTILQTLVGVFGKLLDIFGTVGGHITDYGANFTALGDFGIDGIGRQDTPSWLKLAMFLLGGYGIPAYIAGKPGGRLTDYFYGAGQGSWLDAVPSFVIPWMLFLNGEDEVMSPIDWIEHNMKNTLVKDLGMSEMGAELFADLLGVALIVSSIASMNKIGKHRRGTDIPFIDQLLGIKSGGGTPSFGNFYMPGRESGGPVDFYQEGGMAVGPSHQSGMLGLTASGSPFLFEGGEYIINRRATKEIGVDRLNMINNGVMPSYGSGGKLPEYASQGLVVSQEHPFGFPRDSGMTWEEFKVKPKLKPKADPWYVTAGKMAGKGAMWGLESLWNIVTFFPKLAWNYGVMPIWDYVLEPTFRGINKFMLWYFGSVADNPQQSWFDMDSPATYGRWGITMAALLGIGQLTRGDGGVIPEFAPGTNNSLSTSLAGITPTLPFLSAGTSSKKNNDWLENIALAAGIYSVYDVLSRRNKDRAKQGNYNDTSLLGSILGTNINTMGDGEKTGLFALLAGLTAAGYSYSGNTKGTNSLLSGVGAAVTGFLMMELLASTNYDDKTFFERGIETVGGGDVPDLPTSSVDSYYKSLLGSSRGVDDEFKFHLKYLNNNFDRIQKNSVPGLGEEFSDSSLNNLKYVLQDNATGNLRKRLSYTNSLDMSSVDSFYGGNPAMFLLNDIFVIDSNKTNNKNIGLPNNYELNNSIWRYHLPELAGLATINSNWGSSTDADAFFDQVYDNSTGERSLYQSYYNTAVQSWGNKWGHKENPPDFWANINHMHPSKSSDKSKNWYDLVPSSIVSGDYLASYRDWHEEHYTNNNYRVFEKGGSLKTGTTGLAIGPSHQSGMLGVTSSGSPFLFEGGEYIVNSNAVNKIGVDNLNRLNQMGSGGTISSFENGGDFGFLDMLGYGAAGIGTAILLAMLLSGGESRKIFDPKEYNIENVKRIGKNVLMTPLNVINDPQKAIQTVIKTAELGYYGAERFTQKQWDNLNDGLGYPQRTLEYMYELATNPDKLADVLLATPGDIVGAPLGGVFHDYYNGAIGSAKRFDPLTRKKLKHAGLDINTAENMKYTFTEESPIDTYYRETVTELVRFFGGTDGEYDIFMQMIDDGHPIMFVADNLISIRKKSGMYEKLSSNGYIGGSESLENPDWWVKNGSLGPYNPWEFFGWLVAHEAKHSQNYREYDGGSRKKMFQDYWTYYINNFAGEEENASIFGNRYAFIFGDGERAEIFGTPKKPLSRMNGFTKYYFGLRSIGAETIENKDRYFDHWFNDYGPRGLHFYGGSTREYKSPIDSPPSFSPPPHLWDVYYGLSSFGSGGSLPEFGGEQGFLANLFAQDRRSSAFDKGLFEIGASRDVSRSRVIKGRGKRDDSWGFWDYAGAGSLGLLLYLAAMNNFGSGGALPEFGYGGNQALIGSGAALLGFSILSAFPRLMAAKNQKERDKISRNIFSTSFAGVGLGALGMSQGRDTSEQERLELVLGGLASLGISAWLGGIFDRRRVFPSLEDTPQSLRLTERNFGNGGALPEFGNGRQLQDLGALITILGTISTGYFGRNARTFEEMNTYSGIGGMLQGLGLIIAGQGTKMYKDKRAQEEFVIMTLLGLGMMGSSSSFLGIKGYNATRFQYGSGGALPEAGIGGGLAMLLGLIFGDYSGRGYADSRKNPLPPGKNNYLFDYLLAGIPAGILGYNLGLSFGSGGALPEAAKGGDLAKLLGLLFLFQTGMSYASSRRTQMTGSYRPGDSNLFADFLLAGIPAGIFGYNVGLSFGSGGALPEFGDFSKDSIRNLRYNPILRSLAFLGTIGVLSGSSKLFSAGRSAEGLLGLVVAASLFNYGLSGFHSDFTMRDSTGKKTPFWSFGNSTNQFGPFQFGSGGQLQTGGLAIGPSHQSGMVGYAPGGGPFLFEGGEYIIRKSTVDKMGVGALDRINEGRMFASGGLLPTFKEGTGVTKLDQLPIFARRDLFGLQKSTNEEGQEVYVANVDELAEAGISDSASQQIVAGFSNTMQPLYDLLQELISGFYDLNGEILYALKVGVEYFSDIAFLQMQMAFAGPIKSLKDQLIELTIMLGVYNLMMSQAFMGMFGASPMDSMMAGQAAMGVVAAAGYSRATAEEGKEDQAMAGAVIGGVAGGAIGGPMGAQLGALIGGELLGKPEKQMAEFNLEFQKKVEYAIEKMIKIMLVIPAVAELLGYPDVAGMAQDFINDLNKLLIDMFFGEPAGLFPALRRFFFEGGWTKVVSSLPQALMNASTGLVKTILQWQSGGVFYDLMVSLGGIIAGILPPNIAQAVDKIITEAMRIPNFILEGFIKLYEILIGAFGLSVPGFKLQALKNPFYGNLGGPEYIIDISIGDTEESGLGGLVNYATGGELVSQGGIAVGPSHSSGMLGLTKDGSPFVFEGGEYIISKRSTESIGTQELDRINSTGSVMDTSKNANPNFDLLNLYNPLGQFGIGPSNYKIDVTPSIDLSKMSMNQNIFERGGSTMYAKGVDDNAPTNIGFDVLGDIFDHEISYDFFNVDNTFGYFETAYRWVKKQTRERVWDVWHWVWETVTKWVQESFQIWKQVGPDNLRMGIDGKLLNFWDSNIDFNFGGLLDWLGVSDPSISRMQNGGFVSGLPHYLGGVLAELEGGEYVINSNSAREIGGDFLGEMNGTKSSGFAGSLVNSSMITNNLLSRLIQVVEDKEMSVTVVDEGGSESTGSNIKISKEREMSYRGARMLA